MASERRLHAEFRKRVDARCDLEVAQLAAEQWGVLSTAELHACGLTAGAISRRRARGRLHQLYTGVWAVGHPNPPWEGRLLAAAKAAGANAVLSHWSAAELWGFVDVEDRDPHVTVPGGSARLIPGVVAHRTSMLGSRDVTRWRGVPVTTPVRTVLDLAAIASREVVRRAVRTAQGKRRLHVVQLLEAIERLGPRRGSRMLAEIIATGSAPIRSVLEDAVLELLLAAGFVHPDVNKPLVIEGRRVIPDFRWPDERVIVEADGAAWHGGELARADDAERQALLEAHGERVVRVTWHQAVMRRAETERRVREAGAPLVTERRLASE